MRFFLTIDMGNEAMQTSQDLGAVLIDLGERIHAFHDDNWTGTAGQVRDINGNAVGEWKVEA